MIEGARIRVVTHISTETGQNSSGMEQNEKTAL